MDQAPGPEPSIGVDSAAAANGPPFSARVERTTARRILGIQIDAVDYRETVDEVLRLARRGEAAYVCAANVHAVMEARDSEAVRRALEGAHLAVPDGMPLVWGLRRLGIPGATRVYGPELMVRVLAAAEAERVQVGFFGGEPRVLERLLDQVRRRFPGIRIAYAESPPFRELSPEEDHEVMGRIDASGARILFVALGCPKQERWMAAHHADGKAVMLGVGAAFAFLARTTPQAPAWMQRVGLEWIFRLLTEPRRLWRRYLTTVPLFLVLFGRQLLARSRDEEGGNG